MSQEGKLPIVTITGVSGFVGLTTCLVFLQSGKYQVRGTVRSTQNEAKIQPIKDACGHYFAQLTLVEADLLNKESMIKAIDGSDYVVHTASPFLIEKPKNEEKELIAPARDGTLAVMEACKLSNPRVKRCVITSSIVAIAGDWNNTASFITTDMYTDPAATDGYSRSKVIAEKAAWDYQSKLPQEEQTEIVTINPGLVMGKPLSKGEFSSGTIVEKLLTGGLPMVPELCIGLVDVQDVADAHLAAIEVPEAAGQRFITVGKSYFFIEVANVLRNKYGSEYPKITKKKAPHCIIKCVACFDPGAKMASRQWGIKKEYDTKNTQEVLGIKFKDCDQAITTMAETIIENNYMGLGVKK